MRRIKVVLCSVILNYSLHIIIQQITKKQNIYKTACSVHSTKTKSSRKMQFMEKLYTTTVTKRQQSQLLLSPGDDQLSSYRESRPSSHGAESLRSSLGAAGWRLAIVYPPKRVARSVRHNSHTMAGLLLGGPFGGGRFLCGRLLW